MTNPKLHVTSLEMSKKLCDLGISQKSLFYYLNMYDGSTHILHVDRLSHTNDHYIPAYTSTELMELLPDRIILPTKAPFDCYRFNLFRSIVVEDGQKICPTFIVNYLSDTYEAPHFLSKHLFQNIWAKTLPDALAKTLIYIKENKLDQPYHLPETMDDNINAT